MGIRHTCKRRIFLRWGLRRVRGRKSPEKPHNPWHRRDHTLLKCLHDESVEGNLVTFRPTCQLLIEVRRHPNLEVNHGFGHRKLLKVLVVAGFDQMSNHNRWQIGGAIKKTDITNSFGWRRLWTDQRPGECKPLIR